MGCAAEDTEARNTVIRIGRRAHIRYPLVRRPAVLHATTGSQPCLIRNISAGGLLIRIYTPATIDGGVEIELDNGRRLKGRVAWAGEWEIGIAFAAPIDVEAFLGGESDLQSAENRRALPRTNISCPAQVRMCKRLHKGKITNISEGGVSVETVRPLPLGAEGEITLPDLPPMRASVRWSTGNSAGLQFDEPIPAEVLDNWLNARSA